MRCLAFRKRLKEDIEKEETVKETASKPSNDVRKTELSKLQMYSLKICMDEWEKEQKQNRKLMDYLVWMQQEGEEAEGNSTMHDEAGLLYKELQEMQESWYQELYHGMASEAEKNWVVSFRNAKNENIAQDHTLKEIFAMASVYASYHPDMTKEAFLEYAKQLWMEAHTTSVTEGTKYFCDGSCQGECETLKIEETEGVSETQKETESVSEETEEEGQQEEADSPEAYLQEVQEGDIMVFEDVSDEMAMNGPARAAMQNGDWNFAQTDNEDLDDVKVQPLEQTEEAEKIEESDIEGQEDKENTDITDAINIDEQDLTRSMEEESQGEAISCTGHQEMLKEVTILELDGERSLFSLDSAFHPADSVWPGWTKETMGYVRTLCMEDWEAEYQWSDTAFDLVLPGSVLDEQEIQEILNQLPEDLSQIRRQIVAFALGSVGRVPYYWGGKPAKADYMGNSFGSLLSEKDPEGRSLKGLDCSGWIQWVYWSATGEKPPYGSTSGLAGYGEAVSAEELRAGDILVRTGENAHVVMFLNWTEDGRIRCIHETSSGINNVAVSYTEAKSWETYRRIVD